MAAKKTIVVIGATGNQGGSVARTFLALPNWHVKAVTRDPTSAAAQALAAQGAELVQADLKQPPTLSAAFAGAHAIFLNTDFWAFYYPAKARAAASPTGDVEAVSQQAFANETTDGKNAIDAAAAIPTLERLVISTLGSASEASGGKYARALHTEAKAWIARYAESQPALAGKTSLVVLGSYATNRALAPTRLNAETGRYEFVTLLPPGLRMPVIDAAGSTGAFVRPLVEEEPAGTRLLAYDSYLTSEQVVECWARASGKEVDVVKTSSREMHDRFGAMWEHLDAFDQIVESGYATAIEGLIEPHQLRNRPATKSYEDWLKERNWGEILQQYA